MTKLPCPPQLWASFSRLLDEALARPASERAQWLVGLAPEHAKVRPYLAKVLASSSAALESDLLRPLCVGEALGSEFAEGEQIGPYLLERRLGRGGMGEVWLGSRVDKTPNRRIALKLPLSSLLAGVPRRRFEREGDILAALSHPHIAQLYDAGVADARHPYLAMEWVDGVSIVEHCAATKLSLQHRLDLFLQILDAVGYAHVRLVAHRDLKPNNILVTRDGQVKLLDFGIAKLLGGDTEHGATQLTQVGNTMATPGYAAPEQLAGEPITAAVDLYALGVVLYELLTGRRPFRDTRRAVITGSGAPRASTQIEPGHAEAVGGLGNRQLRRALAGDLDAITAKALQADPALRYRSAEAFARDIRLSRDHRPISARHVGVVSLTLKFARRHWVSVAMSASLGLALIGGSAGIVWQAVRAERETKRATVIKDFLIGVFRASDPRIAANKPRGEITARELLDVSASRIETGFGQTPATQLELLGVTADIYRELDETKRSTALYARETELARKYYGEANAHTIDGLLGQAYNADVDGDPGAALQLLARADPLIRRLGLEESVSRARWWMIRGEALAQEAGQGASSQASLKAAARLFSTVAPQDPLYPDALIDLGALSLETSAFAPSAGYYQRAVEVARASARSEGDLLLANAGLALALKNLGDFRGAAEAFENGTKIALRTYGRDSHSYWAIASDWAKYRYERGDRHGAFAAFESLLQDLPAGLAVFRNASDALEGSQVLRKYGRCLANDGQGARAIELLEQAHSLLKTATVHTSDAVHFQFDLARAYDSGGRTDEARAAFMAALDEMEKRKFPASQLAGAHERWARFLLSQGDSNAAYSQFTEVLRLAHGQLGEPAILAQAGLAAIAVARGDPQGALLASGRAMSQLPHIEGYFDIRTEPYVWAIRASSLLLAGDPGSARALASHARAATADYYDPGSAQFREAEVLLQRIESTAALR